MQQLIVFAHPNSKNSLNSSILEQVVQASSNIKTEVRDLYKLNFNPILTYTEIANPNTHDILIEQEYIHHADIITFIYPLWWMGFPAILKGYIDRVFSCGFAYETVNDESIGLLTDKKIRHIITLGSKIEEYNKLGFVECLKVSLLDGLFNFCGIFDITYDFYGNIHNLDQKQRQDILKKVYINTKQLLAN